MAERFTSPLPVWRLHFHLLGGKRRVGGLALIYLAAAVFGIIVMRRLFRHEPLHVFIDGTVNVLGFVQLLIGVPGIAGAVHRAFLRDHQTRMMDSHRLTPLSGLTLMLGQLFGASQQMLLLFGTNVVIGSALLFFGSAGTQDWLLGNLLVLSMGYMLASGLSPFAFRAGKPIPPGPIIMTVAALTFPLLFIPGLMLLLGNLAGVVAVQVLVHGGKAGAAAILLIILNVGLSIFWLSAAIAKYRRPELPALNPPRALALVLLWLALSVGGAVMLNLFEQQLTGMVSAADLREGVWIATWCTTLPIAGIALVGVLNSHRIFRRGGAPRHRFDLFNEFGFLLLIWLLICGTFLVAGEYYLGVMWISDEVGETGVFRASIYSALALLFGLLTIRGAFACLRTFSSRAGLTLVLACLAFLWIAPPLTDQMRVVVTETPQYQPDYSWLLGASPTGTFVAVWAPVRINLVPGLIVQAVLAVAISIFAFSRRRRVPGPR